MRQDQPTSALGRSANLKLDTQAVDGNAASRASTYLRFTVPALASGERITGATLRLDVTNGTTNGPAVWRTATAWNETTVTWNQGQPARSGTTPIGNAGAMGTGTVSNPLSGVTTAGDLSLRLFGEYADGLDLYAREYGTAADRPQLVLTVARG